VEEAEQAQQYCNLVNVIYKAGMSNSGVASVRPWIILQEMEVWGKYLSCMSISCWCTIVNIYLNCSSVEQNGWSH